MLGDFEAPTYGAWTATGDFAGTAPHVGGDGRVGERSVDTFFGAQRDSDENRGTIQSPTFTLDHDYLSFEVAGGAQPSTPGLGSSSTGPSYAPPPGTRPARSTGRPGTSPTCAASRPGS